MTITVSCIIRRFERRGGESRRESWGWRIESGSWFQRLGDAYLNERSVIFKEEMVGGRERVTTDEEEDQDRSDITTKDAELPGVVNYWIIFNGESKVELGLGSRVYIWRKVGEERHPACTLYCTAPQQEVRCFALGVHDF